MRIRFAAALAALTTVALAAQAGALSVEQNGQQFSQKSAAISVGDAVTFDNHDDVTHNINISFADDDPVDLGLQKPGEKVTYKFDKAGRFTVRCSIHPGMKMTVNVQ
jgi:plastocyanin